ncbi:hypothetical protein [Paraglaciecola sp. L3A3]|nr:hypothetical protein [Paraglaciecola sp. L3A3]
MHDEKEFKDPFSFTHFLIAVGLLVALPLMHVVIGWFVYYI